MSQKSSPLQSAESVSQVLTLDRQCPRRSVMLPFGMKRAYMRIFVVSGLFNVVAIVPFSYFFGATGASISILLTEVIVTGAMGFVVWRAGILHKNEAARDL
jgi:O-antigen/teichoic acid export membrane protein